MTWLFSVVCCVVAINSAAGQVLSGDSLRVRDARDGSWQYGRLVSHDGLTFSIARLEDTLRVAVASLRRVERWQRNDKKLVLVAASAGMLAATVGYYTTPMEEKKQGGGCVISAHSQVCTTITVRSRPGNLRAMQGIGALGGTAMGFLGLAIWPGQWKVIISR
jgi:hypothetical protein